MVVEMEHVGSDVHLDLVERRLLRKLGCDFLSNGEMYMEKQKSDITQVCFLWY